MKKLTLIIAIVLSGMLLQAQIKGIDLSKAIEVTDTVPEDFYYGKLIIFDSMYTINYKKNVVGVVHSHRKLLSILEANDLDFDEPYIDNSYLASEVDGYTDYENIPHSVIMGRSIIEKVWVIDGFGIGWRVNEYVFGVGIITDKE